MTTADDNRLPESSDSRPAVPEPTGSGTAAERARTWSSEGLFGDAVEVFIPHGDQLYQLRRTKNGKLILCK